MNVMETILILFMVAVSLSLVLAGVWRLADVENRLRNGFVVAVLLGYTVLVFVGLPSVWLSSGAVILAGIAGATVIGSLNRSKGSVVTFLVTAAARAVFQSP